MNTISTAPYSNLVKTNEVSDNILNLSKTSDNKFANNLHSIGNSPKEMRTPERKNLIFYIKKLIDFVIPNTPQVTIDKNISNNISNQLDKIKDYDMEILKHGSIKDVPRRQVARELMQPTTPKSVADKLLILADKAKNNNDTKLFNKCISLFNKATNYGLNRELWNREAGQNENIWSRPEQVTSAQRRALDNLA